MYGLNIDHGSHAALRAELEAAMVLHEARIVTLQELLHECLVDADDRASPTLIATCKAIIARYDQALREEHAAYVRFKKDVERATEALARDIAALTDQAVALQRSAG